MKHIQLFLFIFLFQHVSRSQIGPLLVGATPLGGTNNSGTIIAYIGGDTSISRICSFPVNTYYSGPWSANLTQAPNGRLYGLIGTGGPGHTGCLFEYDLIRNAFYYRILFDSATGDYPQGVLLLASDSLMYGTTTADGSSGGGNLFSYVPGSYSIRILASLPYYSHQIGPLMQADNGNIYGMTSADGTNAGGTLFEYDTLSHTYSDLYDFPAAANSAGGLIQVGHDTLYGVTQGSATDGGMLFCYAIASHHLTTLVNFPIGTYSRCTLVHGLDGLLYGTAASGNIIFTYNTITGRCLCTCCYVPVFDFNRLNLYGPSAGLIQASDSMLYGVLSSSIYSYDLVYSILSNLVPLTQTTGEGIAYGSLTEYKSAPIVFRQPASQVTCAGHNVAFSIKAGGYAMIAQWQRSTNGGASYVDMPGERSGTYSLTAYPPDSGSFYRVILNNPYGSDTSNAVSLKVYSPPPPDTTNVAGCLGSHYILDGQNFAYPGTYTHIRSGVAPGGCDRTMILHLTAYTRPPDTVLGISCPDNEYWIGNHMYNAPGTYIDTLTSAETGRECDSVIVLILQPFSGNYTQTVISSGHTLTALQDSALYTWVDCLSQYDPPYVYSYSQSFTPYYSGAYQCEVTYEGCSYMTDCTYISVGIFETGKDDFSLFPNPAIGSFTIINNHIGNLYVNIGNVLGEKLKSYKLTGTKHTFDISDLSAGIYVVQISDGKQTLKVMKLVKE
jgi:hypothetical protein